MIDIEEIQSAQQRLSGQIIHTPIEHSPSLSQLSNSEIYLKLECLQTTGSFKLRGATNALLQLTDEQRQRGIACVSTGNHGRGLALAAKHNQTKAIVCMSNLVPQNKIDGIRALGAEVRIIGNSQDDAEQEVHRLINDENMVTISPFDDKHVIAGQGTIGLEILDTLPDVETVVVPLSGGGLLSGIACVIQALKPTVKVIGITIEKGCAMYDSLKAGKPVDVEETPSLADSLTGNIGMDNRYTLNIISTLVDEVLRVSETEIADAIRHAYLQERQIIEGGASVGIAALLSNKLSNTGKTVVVVSGKNIDMEKHREIVN